jgi:nitronate monooxygenase
MAEAHHRRARRVQGQHPEKKVAPFAVNQIVHSSNDRLQHDVDLCEKYKVPIQITSLRAPDDVVKVGQALRLPGVP